MRACRPSCQSQYSLFDRRPELALSNYCESAGIRHVCYGTLAGGLLAKRWEGVGSIKPETRSQVKYLQVLEDPVGYEGYQKLLELLEKIASHYGVGVSHVATKYILNRPSVACAIVGVRNSRHVADNCKTSGSNFLPRTTRPSRRSSTSTHAFRATATHSSARAHDTRASSI